MTNEFRAFAPIFPISTAVPVAAVAAVAPAVAAVPGVVPVAGSAHDLLDEMMARVGVDGLVAAQTDAGLLAQVDQHAAAVRDALTHAGRAVDADGLAMYAKSIAAAAWRVGRPVPEPGQAYVTGAAWLSAEWHLLRLVAVCMIAESAGLL
jgi:uncharacterized protein DUF6401